MTKLDLDNTFSGADALVWTCEWQATDVYGKHSEIAALVREAREKLAEARQKHIVLVMGAALLPAEA